MNRILTALLLIAASWAAAREAPAQQVIRHYRRPSLGRVYRMRPPASAAPARPYRYHPYDYYRDLYPRYTGGFHERFFSNYGVPSGDVGLRGNGIYWTPW